MTDAKFITIQSLLVIINIPFIVHYFNVGMINAIVAGFIVGITYSAVSYK